MLNDEKGDLKVSKCGMHLFGYYGPLGITMILCLVLSVLSFRIAYYTSGSVRELKQQVAQCKAVLDQSWVKEIAEFERIFYEDYVDRVDSNKPKNSDLLQTVDNSVGETSNDKSSQSDVIGVMKYDEKDTPPKTNPEAIILKILMGNEGKDIETIEPAGAIKANNNDGPYSKQRKDGVSAKSPSTIYTTLPNTNQTFDVKYFSKRSLNPTRFYKIPLASNKASSKAFSNTAESLSTESPVEEFTLLTTIKNNQGETFARRNRNRPRHNIETLDQRTTFGKKTLPIIHYEGDSSGYVVGKHTNYNGNGHISHPSQVYSDWIVSEWAKSSGMEESFSMEKGLLKVKEAGIYLIYVQIYYLDDHDTNGYRVYKNEETLLQCTTMTHSTERIFKGNTCYTSRAEYLKESDVISIRDLANNRYSIFESGKSFFGLIKLK